MSERKDKAKRGTKGVDLLGEEMEMVLIILFGDAVFLMVSSLLLFSSCSSSSCCCCSCLDVFDMFFTC